MKTDIYDRITNQIVAELEKGVRPWMKPWNAEHAAGRITRPLRFNGVPYQGINVLMLWPRHESRKQSGTRRDRISGVARVAGGCCGTAAKHPAHLLPSSAAVVAIARQ